MRLPHNFLFFCFLALSHLLCLCRSHFCSEGCDLIYNAAFPCHSKLAFVAKDADLSEIHSIIANDTLLCFSDPSSNSSNTNAGVQQRDDRGIDWDASTFELSAYVLLWQSLVISLIVPSIALMLFAILRLVFVRLFELVRCRENAKCSMAKCGCCLALISAQYRQKRRNRRFDHEENGANRHRSRASVEGKEREERKEKERDREYQHIPLNEKDSEFVERRPQIVAEVLEEVSIERGELDRYLGVPNDNDKGIELSFSSHGLRQICNREIL